MKLYDEHAAQRDRFEILVFHDATAKILEELDQKLEPIVRGPWEGRELPFPTLMDSTGKTIEDFGINAYPTIFLIDPKGKIVKGGSERMLKEKLEAY